METRKRSHGEKKSSKKVFVTVGTTKFDKLVQTICAPSTLKCLQMLGYSEVLLQIGGGETVPYTQSSIPGISIDHYKYKSSIKDDIELADLVISHAGAGSCLETLSARKHLLVVINDDLMDNHQLELAYQLHKDNHLYYCTCQNILETLEDIDFTKLEPFKPGKPEKFAEYLDQLMGFT